jgi:murein DD-endopeptidase MepM/ murein hydrolase activator NlpD
LRYCFVFCIIFLLYSTGYSDEPDIKFHGKFHQGGLILGQAPSGSKVKLNSQILPISQDGFFFIGFPYNSKLNATFQVTLPTTKTFTKKFNIKKRSYITQRINNLSTRHVRPNTFDMQRIQREISITKKALSHTNRKKRFAKTGFIWPAIGRISGVYGSRRILNGIPKKPHLGVDIAAPSGTPVRAVGDGIILFVHQDMFFNGKTIFIDHGLGLLSIYLHLNAISIKAGDHVLKGDHIGSIGMTGRATGPHLHWEMRVGNTKLDPRLIVGPMPVKY